MNLLALGLGAWVGIGVAVAVALILIIWIIATFNKFIGLRTHCEDAFSTIDIYLKKRFDLIPNIVETVKGYAKHESETFTRVTEARAAAMKAVTTEDKIKADARLTGAIRGFNRIQEAYPELKANTNFLDLQNQLKTIENELVNARKYYNATVREYNRKRQTFPSLIIAHMMHLEAKSMYEIENAEERQNVKVQF